MDCPVTTFDCVTCETECDLAKKIGASMQRQIDAMTRGALGPPVPKKELGCGCRGITHTCNTLT